MLVRHKVEDYEKWKPVFDDHQATRRESGGKGGFLLRNADDPNETLILLEWPDLEDARRFARSEDLRETMQRAGVAEQPDIYLLEEVERSSRVVVDESPCSRGAGVLVGAPALRIPSFTELPRGPILGNRASEREGVLGS